MGDGSCLNGLLFIFVLFFRFVSFWANAFFGPLNIHYITCCGMIIFSLYSFYKEKTMLTTHPLSQPQRTNPVFFFDPAFLCSMLFLISLFLFHFLFNRPASNLRSVWIVYLIQYVRYPTSCHRVSKWFPPSPPCYIVILSKEGCPTEY